jgi:hypothetical protein
MIVKRLTTLRSKINETKNTPLVIIIEFVMFSERNQTSLSNALLRFFCKIAEIQIEIVKFLNFTQTKINLRSGVDPCLE